MKLRILPKLLIWGQEDGSSARMDTSILLANVAVQCKKVSALTAGLKSVEVTMFLLVVINTQEKLMVA